ncbi:MAG: Rad52/Rad22 family DNA repair protein [Pyrinomonadaceae bacterium]
MAKTDISEETRPKPLKEIIENLSREIPKRLLKTKPAGGGGNQKLTFIEWHTAVKFLDLYAPGWCYDVSVAGILPAPERLPNDKKSHRGKVIIKATISIPTADHGVVSRSSLGIEDDVVTGYGDPSSNAESMALRRAASKFGLGLYLYEKG